jgi:hypothetical protein
MRLPDDIVHRALHILRVPDISIHLIPFIEIVAALVSAPLVGAYAWRGVRRRRQARLAARNRE